MAVYKHGASELQTRPHPQRIHASRIVEETERQDERRPRGGAYSKSFVGEHSLILDVLSPLFRTIKDVVTEVLLNVGALYKASEAASPPPE